MSFLIPCAIIALACIPMILGIVPPNRFYGFRTAKTLSDPDLWIDANRFSGIALFIAAALSAVVFLVRPDLASGRSIAGLVVFLVPLAVALVASFAYVARRED